MFDVYEVRAMTESGEGDFFLSMRQDSSAAAELKKRFPPPYYFTASIDGAAIADKAALMDALAKAFSFPAYFGKNWDALADCLRSLPDWLPAGGYVLVINNSSLFLSRSPSDRESFSETVAAAGEFLREKLKIVFRVALL